MSDAIDCVWSKGKQGRNLLHISYYLFSLSLIHQLHQSAKPSLLGSIHILNGQTEFQWSRGSIMFERQVAVLNTKAFQFETMDLARRDAAKKFSQDPRYHLTPLGK